MGRDRIAPLTLARLRAGKVVLASHNPHKRVELAPLAQGLGWELLELGREDGADELAEPGPTVLDNARAKASWAFARSGLPALADDTALEVDALGGAPGVLTARYAGVGASSGERNARLLRELADVPLPQRTARFRCVLVLELGETWLWAEGVTEGRIALGPAGGRGFGYDPLFLPTGEGVTYAELDPGRLAEVGHRQRAFSALRRQLESL